MSLPNNEHLYGIITRYEHTHGQRVHRAVKRNDHPRARWYGNYGMFRYARRMSATYRVGGESEFPFFSEIASRHVDPLVIAKVRRHRKLTNQHNPS